MFAYLVKFMGVQGATAFICCFLTSAVQLLILVLSYRKFKYEVRFSLYHKKQIEVLGEFYGFLALARGSVHTWTITDKSDIRRENLGLDTIERIMECTRCYKSKLIYIPEKMRASIIEFDTILRDGLFNSYHSKEPQSYSKENIAQFVHEADKILDEIEREIRKIISAN